jgi:hypothetical protein
MAEVTTTLADLQGNWGYYVDPSWFSDITISSSGAISGSDDSGCSFSGQVSIIDTDYSIANVTLNASSCDDSSVNGSYSGLGLLYFDASDASGDQFVFMVSSSTQAGFDVLDRL